MVAMSALNAMLEELQDKIIEEAVVLLGLRASMTLSSREVQTAVRLVLPGELAKHAISEGTKAVTKFCSTDKGACSMRAGLQFPVSHVRNVLKAKSRTRVGKGAPVYLAAVLEYISAEVLELAGNAARDSQLRRITPRHIMLAVRCDAELDSLFKGYVMNGGVVPHIHMALVRQGKTNSAPMKKFNLVESNEDEESDDGDEEAGYGLKKASLAQKAMKKPASKVAVKKAAWF
jgi:histone H2A